MQTSMTTFSDKCKKSFDGNLRNSSLWQRCQIFMVENVPNNAKGNQINLKTYNLYGI